MRKTNKFKSPNDTQSTKAGPGRRHNLLGWINRVLDDIDHNRRPTPRGYPGAKFRRAAAAGTLTKRA